MTEIEPKRIKLERTEGWRKPDGVIVVTRPGKWGNPFTIESAIEAGMIERHDDPADQRKFVTDVFADWLASGPNSDWWFADGHERFVWMTANLATLKGKDLACWCPLEGYCHADVLIDYANGLIRHRI